MHSEGGRRPWCSAKYTQHPPCMAINIPNFYPDFTSERWTIIELRRLDNVLVSQRGFGCPCPDPRDLTNVIGLGHRPWIHPEGVPLVADYAYGELPRNMPFLYVWFVVNSRETSKGSIPGEQLWVGM